MEARMGISAGIALFGKILEYKVLRKRIIKFGD